MGTYGETGIDLVNTYNVAADEEQLGSVVALIEFAADHGLETGSVTAEDLERVRLARSVLRAAIVTDDEGETVAQLNLLLAASRPRPRLVDAGGDTWAFEYADPDAGLADRILATATGQLLEEIRVHGMHRFSTCDSSTCDDVFVDKSRNHSRRFCSPDVCGNREAQRAYRARQAKNSGA